MSPLQHTHHHPPTPPAGREAEGHAYRLFTEAAFAELAPTTAPEIQRTNLASVVLQLKAMGARAPGQGGGRRGGGEWAAPARVGAARGQRGGRRCASG
jgi:hypothetical protein